jgi:formamidopyrimidine-DNA glycosylase
MPELPEVETTRRGIGPPLRGRVIAAVTLRERRLRWPVPRGLAKRLIGQRVHEVDRRGKYLLMRLDEGCLLLHLGMSGSLRLVPPGTPAAKHDHVDIAFDQHYTRGDPLQHKLLAGLGPEPLGPDFDGDYLHRLARRRTQTVKTFIMDSRIVTGVGNIYANEALFLSGIHPQRAAGRVSLPRYRRLAENIKRVLLLAIEKGGTTLRDFTSGEGRPGYFRQDLNVYDRADQPCRICAAPIRRRRIGQRSSFYCVNCQR